MWYKPKPPRNFRPAITLTSALLFAIVLVFLHYNGMFDRRQTPEEIMTATSLALANSEPKTTATATPVVIDTATPMPTATVTPPPDGITQAALAAAALARTGPGPEFSVLGSLETNTIVSILSQSPNGVWLHVLQPDGLPVWVMTSLFAQPLHLSEIPTEAVPTPRPAPASTATPDLSGGRSAYAIGIVAGHRGINPSVSSTMSGAFCPDGLTEREVNEAVAVEVVRRLQSLGYDAVLLDEFDARLTGFQGLAVASIHADVCSLEPELTGFKVSSFAGTTIPEADMRLAQCLISNYAAATGLPFHNSVTADMTLNHIRHELASTTPAVIIETGFLGMDRDLLENDPYRAAQGIVNGILCFLP